MTKSRVTPTTTPERGLHITTSLGIRFYPFDPRPEEVNIYDIAHSLSLQCRWGGHVREFYSVAQHSVMVSHVCAPADALIGLLHDAAEAYVVDLPRPIKRDPRMTAYLDIEVKVHRAVATRFGISEELPDSVTFADEIALSTERRDLLPPTQFLLCCSLDLPPLPDRLVPWKPAEAEHAFLLRFKDLGGVP